MKRTAIISYLALPGIPVGFYQQGNCDIHTRDYAKITDYETLYKKNELLKELHTQVMEKIDDYSTIYIMVGRFPPSCDERSWHLFEMLKEYHYKRYNEGKKVVIVGCECSAGWKQHLVNYSNNKITWEKVACEPQKELLVIIERENALEPA